MEDALASGQTSANGRDDQSVLQGIVEAVTFHNTESLYTVIKISPERGYDDPQGGFSLLPGRVSAVGRAQEPSPGMRLRLFGNWATHRDHGRRFEFDGFEVLAPQDADGLVKYLSSGAFQGIGPILARRIADKLGPSALDAIEKDPEVLKEVPGLRKRSRETLAAKLKTDSAAHRARSFLRGIGLGPAQAQSAEKKLGPKCETIVRRDPFVLAQVVPGIGFARADRFAQALGFAQDSIQRCRAALLFALGAAADDGHSVLPCESLLADAKKLLRTNVPDARIQESLDELEREGSIAVERKAVPADETPAVLVDANVYLPWLLASESGLARSLARLAEANPRTLPIDPATLRNAEAESGLSLHPTQREAVLGLCSTSAGLLTGGPGVGKTTIVRLLADVALRSGQKVLLASPTGRAAKRLSEATGREAQTIHRLLGFDPRRGGFAHSDRSPLEAGLLVVDEISMLDVVLGHHLLKAVQSPTRLVLVGDQNQLPSVGPGNVLSDLVASERIPTWRLTRIFRQEEQSLIVENAHRILNGELPVFAGRDDSQGDFYFFPSDHPAETADKVVDVVTRRIPQRFGLDWMRDVQVLAPMYRGECGVDALNDRLRDALGIGGREVRRGDRLWRVGDRVIHTRNDYDKQVFNGDMGRIRSISAEGAALVSYPEQDVAYTRDELSDLQPAFAITVHRSQGAEYPAVVIPLVTQHFLMLQRNLLYTAVTRASRLVVLVGSRRALQMAVDNAEQSQRRSGLADRLKALLPAAGIAT